MRGQEWHAQLSVASGLYAKLIQIEVTILKSDLESHKETLRHRHRHQSPSIRPNLHSGDETFLCDEACLIVH